MSEFNPTPAECEKRLKERYDAYNKDAEAAEAAGGEEAGAGLLDALAGYAAGLASSYASDMINELIEESGIGDALTTLATTLAMLLTIGPQMYLALFAICTDVIRAQAVLRINVATEVKDLIDMVIIVFEELLLSPNTRGTVLARIKRSKSKVRDAHNAITQIIDVAGASTDSYIFPANKYSRAIDDVGAAIDILGGGSGKGRPQREAAGVSEFVDEDGNFDKSKIKNPYKNNDGSDVTGETFEREKARLARLAKKLVQYGKLVALGMLGTFFRTVSLAELVTAIKQGGTMVKDPFPDLLIKGRKIDMEPRDTAGLLGLSESIDLSITGLNALDRWLGGDNFSSLSKLLDMVITQMMTQGGVLKNITIEMQETLEIGKSDTAAITNTIKWTAILEAQWQLGQSGGPIGAVADDLAEVQEQLQGYKDLKAYLSDPDIDWGRGYTALSLLVGQTVKDVIDAARATDLSELSKLYKHLVHMREIVVNGIKDDNILISKIDQFDGNVPLLQEAKALLKKVKGTFGDALANGDGAAAIGDLANKMGQIGAAKAVYEDLQDLRCKAQAGIGDPNVDPDASQKDTEATQKKEKAAAEERKRAADREEEEEKKAEEERQRQKKADEEQKKRDDKRREEWIAEEEKWYNEYIDALLQATESRA